MSSYVYRKKGKTIKTGNYFPGFNPMKLTKGNKYKVVYYTSLQKKSIGPFKSYNDAVYYKDKLERVLPKTITPKPSRVFIKKV